MNNIQDLLNKIKIIPKQIHHYLNAITHISYAKENKTESYERLEFLGDAIIYKLVAQHLFNKNPHLDENVMSKTRIIIVQAKTMILAAKKIELEKYIRVGKVVEYSGGIVDSMLEDAFEALVAAIYLDQGELKAYKFLKQTIIHYYEIHSLKNMEDFKSQLQEKTFMIYKKRPFYEISKGLLGKVMCKVFVNDLLLAKGYGKTNKEAEIDAAKKALWKIKTPLKQQF